MAALLATSPSRGTRVIVQQVGQLAHHADDRNDWYRGLNRDDERLRTSWIAFREALPSAQSIVIAGGGPAGVETAGELGEYLNGRAGWFNGKLEHPTVSITVVTAGSEILPVLRPTIARKAEAYLAKVGVAVIKDARVETVAPQGAGTDNALTSKAALTLADGKTLEADLCIPATGTSLNTHHLHRRSAPHGGPQLGIPTANIPVKGLSVGGHEEVESGVYYGWAGLSDDAVYPATDDTSGPATTTPTTTTTNKESTFSIHPMVMSIGWNPHFKNSVRSVEVHLLASFPADFYRHHLNVVILGRIRPEFDYVSKEALVDDIRTDIDVARRSLARGPYEAFRTDEYLRSVL
ncbi:MAG: hypothetical protein M1838_003914 [Thelocarpon superellum]|nr:MAG: hypothetical protein M1838_003914 [Thelocarpon superellum]